MAPTLPLMRILLGAGAGFVLAAGAQLYVLTTRTDRYFAWTITNPLTAASIGAFYLGAVVIAGLSARQRYWSMARVGVPGVLVFVWLTLIASLVDIGVMHLHAALLPRTAAYAWLAIYVLEPILLLAALGLQLRRRGVDPPRPAPAPAWYRLLCAVPSVATLAWGVALYAAPGSRFIWTLTPIAARTLGAWLIALALLLAAVAVEGDWLRVRPATAGLLMLAGLQLVAVLRYPGIARGAGTGLWLALWVLLALLGGYGLLRARTGERM